MAQLGLDRLSYEALEQAVIDTLQDEAYPFTHRVLAAFVLVDAAVIEYGRGSKSTSAFSVWLDEMLGRERQNWVHQEATVKESRVVNSGSQRRALASIICGQEGRLGREIGARSPGGLGCALAIARGRGRLFLPSLGTEVRLDDMERVEMDQDVIRSATVLMDYLVDCIHRGLLVRHSTVLKGMRFLLVRLALIRWYATAVAALRGLERAGEAEVRGSRGRGHAQLWAGGWHGLGHGGRALQLPGPHAGGSVIGGEPGAADDTKALRQPPRTKQTARDAGHPWHLGLL